MAIPLLQKHDRINASVPVTISSLFLLLLSFYMRYSISDVELVNYCIILNLAVGSKIFPTTVHQFNKEIYQSYGALTYNFFCSNCTSLIAEKSHYDLDVGVNVECGNCHAENELLLENENFFITFDIANQIKSIFSNRDVARYFKRPNPDKTISDVYDGQLYVELADNFDNFLTYNFNVDSAPLFNTSNIKLTPILLLINELPLSIRNQNVVVAGLWCGSKKVINDLYLKHFTEKNIDIDHGGVYLRTGEGEREDLIKVSVKPLCCCVDSVARASTMNMSQFNGYNSCPWCFIEGEYIEGSVKFPLPDDDLPPLRTDDDVLDAAIVAAETGSQFQGFNGVNQLTRNPTFKALRAFTPEYLHSVCLGVTRQFSNVWCTEVGAVYYIGSPAKIARANKILSKIQLPNEFKSCRYNISKRSFWKGSDWRNFLLYSSYFVTIDTLPPEYALHWSLFIRAIYILMSTNITEDQLEEAKQLLIDFNYGVQHLYGETQMTYNVHLLLHLPEAVKNCGPLFACSAFPFEAYLFILKNMVNSPSGALAQICKKICLRAELKEYINTHEINPEVMKALQCMDLKCGVPPKPVKFVKSNGTINLNAVEITALENHDVELDDITLCRSVTIKYMYLKSSYGSHISRCNNCLIYDDRDNMYILHKIFYVNNPNESENYRGLVQKIFVKNENEGFNMGHIKIIDFIDEAFKVLSLNCIIGKCFYFEQAKADYIIKCVSSKEAD